MSSKEMSAYKSDSDQEIPGVDPIQSIKSSQIARAEQIWQRASWTTGVAVGGMLMLSMLQLFESPPRGWRSLYDNSFQHRFSFAWLNLMLACLPIALLAKFRGKYPFLFSPKARTPSMMIGVIGLGILVYVAAGFFSHPYTGARLDRATEGWYFIGGWFLILWGIVFRK